MRVCSFYMPLIRGLRCGREICKKILQQSKHINFYMMKRHRSKRSVFLFTIKTVFSMFDKILVLFAEVQMPDKVC